MFLKHGSMRPHVPKHATFVFLPGLACTHFFTFFCRPDSQIWIRHETDLQQCYGRKNTGKFGVSANRIQWKTPRTKIRPKSQNKQFELYFAYPSNPGFSEIMFVLRSARPGDYFKDQTQEAYPMHYYHWICVKIVLPLQRARNCRTCTSAG